MDDITTDIALDIFGLQTHFTREQLKTAFRHVSLLVHPDRGGSAEMFDLVRKCHIHLHSELDFREGTRMHLDLKRGYEGGSAGPADPPEPRFTAACPTGRFNIDHFNTVFSDVSVPDPASARGYGNLDECAPPPDHSQKQLAVVQPATTAATRLQFTDLGVDEVHDFSTSTGHLQGYDCMHAYGQRSMRAEFEAHQDTGPVTIDRATASRSAAIPADWQERQLEHERQRLAQEERTERHRREVMLMQQRRAAEAHDRASQMLLNR